MTTNGTYKYGRINGVVGLTGFSDKKMSGSLVGRTKIMVIITGWP